MSLKTIQIQALILLLWPLIVFSIPSEFSIRGYEHDPSSTENLIELFEQWIEKHERIYEHPADKLRGFENFVRNFAFVQEKNSKSANGGGHVVGLNKFADLSNEEFKAKHISKIHMGKSRERKVELLLWREHEENCDAPKSLDWREKGVVTAVKNQGQCGSCWAFSSTGAMEGSSAIATGELVSLSEQELVDCVGTNWGCDGGYMDYAFEWVVNNGGIDTEADYGYTAKDGACNSNKEANKVVTINGYIDVPSSDSALLCAVAKQPVSVGIDASQLDFQLYSGGIFDGPCSSDPDEIDHAVLIVGYGSENNVDYWIVKNSWGTSWGDKGYIKIKRNKGLENGTCAINAMASYPTINSVSSS